MTPENIAEIGGIRKHHSEQKSLSSKHYVFVSTLLINAWKKYKGIQSMHKNETTGEWEITYINNNTIKA